MNWMDDLAARLDGTEIVTEPVVLRGKSRDFYRYSPVLKQNLDRVRAEGVVVPRSGPAGGRPRDLSAGAADLQIERTCQFSRHADRGLGYGDPYLAGNR